MARVRLLEVVSKRLGRRPNYKFRGERTRTLREWSVGLGAVYLERGRHYQYRGYVIGAVVKAYVVAERNNPVLRVQHDDGFALQVYVGPQLVQDYNWWRPAAPRWDTVQPKLKRGQVAKLVLYWFDLGGYGVLRLRPEGLREVTGAEHVLFLPFLVMADIAHAITELTKGGIV